MNPSPSPSVYHSHGRKRSSTISSMIPPPPQLTIGQTKWITLWAADPLVAGSRANLPDIGLNRESWPGLAVGDVIRISSGKKQDLEGVLFIVPPDDATRHPLNQITIARPVATIFGFKNHSEILLTKVDRSAVVVDYVEIEFRDQYLGRCDMWRLSNSLKNTCVYVGQKVNFIGCISASIRKVYVKGKRASSGIIDATTKTIFRSLSAKTTIFIQVCKELWEFADDGERFTEKIAHSFLPELIKRWEKHQTNHVVTVVLISRVFYDPNDLEYAAGPLRQTDEGTWYKDFFKVVVDLEVVSNWTEVLLILKEAFWTFQRDILLTHHYHRNAQAGGDVRLVGTISFAHDGPLLEALNLALNPTEAHYIDRSLSLTGSSVIVITPGTGYFRVQKQLLRLTTLRMLDQGFGLDLVCLAKRPLHTSPIFSFQGIEPTPIPPSEGISRAMDPLWGGGRNESEHPPKDLKTFWWEPFWVCASFWDKQRDMPFRQDRFVTRARMYEVQMLGLLEHDVTATISIPQMDPSHIAPTDGPNTKDARRLAREEFDRNVFAPVADKRHGHHHAHHHHTTPQTRSNSNEASAPSTACATDLESSQSSLNELLEETPRPNQPQPPMPTLPFKNVRKPNLRRASTSRARLEVVPSFKGHSPEPLPALSLPTVDSTPSTPVRSYVQSSQPQRRSVSPSQESTRSTSTMSSGRRKTGPGGSLTSLAKNWLFTPFRPAAALATASTVHIERLAEDVAAGPLSIPPPAAAAARPVALPPPDPITIAKRRVEPKRVSRPAPEDSASPSDDPALAALRRASTVPAATPAPQPELLTNPCRPSSALPENQIALARRWQHLFPRPSFAHQIKWRSICTPACLPLSVSYLPPQREVNTTWRDYDYIVMLNSEDVRSSFLLGADENMDQNEQALLVMRGMASLRLTQGFQFVVSSNKNASTAGQGQNNRQSKSSGKGFPVVAGSALNRSHPVGISEVLKSARDVVCLSMCDQIQQISYDPLVGEVLVRRWIRRSSHPTDPFRYECLVWPKLGTGYTEISTTFSFPVLEEYGWNRTDTLVAGYERDLSDALRYWRTRYLVIPSEDPPPTPFYAPRGDTLDEEEIRLLGVTEKLADLFARARWLRPDEHDLPPPRFVETTLDPAYCVQDEALMAQIDEVHACGPLKKKRMSERVLEDMSPGAVARAMREEGGVPFKDHKWHGIEYSDSFTGRDLVSWLVREFKDVSTREQGVEQGNRLLESGLFEHCRGAHGLLDGHYYYRLTGDYASPAANKQRQWPFRTAAPLSARPSIEDVKNEKQPTLGMPPKPHPFAVKRSARRLVLSQTMTIDVDPSKRSDQAERVILHHDIIHNPTTAFHFELNWLGTTARFIDDMITTWNHALKRYGLKIVEAYVDQIVDINQTNVFQSCFPIRLALEPPRIPDLAKRLPEGTQTTQFFEYAILRHFGYILDISAGTHYPDSVDVFYSYRRSAFTYSQFVHKSGLAFVQVVGGTEGFRWLTNRLLAPTNHAMGAQGKSKHHTRADGVRRELARFCEDPVQLQEFYDDVVAKLPPLPPPPTSVPGPQESEKE
ncbi:vacuolar membrane-associated protein iml1 [Ceratobasidium sp. UAMH 11750]|nr:vacuolar membrane-associated protein iml1 [Ceratobasidium sp. UAMH 11750]